MHGQETTIQQTFHLHESQGFFYLFTTNVKGSMQCFLACILHAPAPNTHPNFCPPEVNPCSVKTIHKNLVATKRVHLLLHPPAILQLAFFFFCQLLIITTDLLYLVSIESTAPPPTVSGGGCVHILSLCWMRLHWWCTVVVCVFPPPLQELARVNEVLEVRESRMVDMSRENITLTEANQTLKR